MSSGNENQAVGEVDDPFDIVARARAHTLVSESSTEAAMIARIKDLRLKRGWSQDTLAQQVHALGLRWHQNTIARLEAGERRLAIDEAAALAAVFGMAPAQLFAPPPFDQGHIKGLQKRQTELEAAVEAMIVRRAAEVRTLRALQAQTEDVSRRLHLIEIQLDEAMSELARNRHLVGMAQEIEEGLARAGVEEPSATASRNERAEREVDQSG